MTGANDWEVDLESSDFPGSQPGKGQELNEETHPDLRLGEAMVSVPNIRPGDMVFWFCDVIHAVESVHQGKGAPWYRYLSVPVRQSDGVYIDGGEPFR